MTAEPLHPASDVDERQENRDQVRDAELREPDAVDAVDEAGRELVILPGTGEAIDLAATTDVLAGVVTELDLLVERIGDAKAVLKAELAKRLDKANKRSAVVGDFELGVNAPTTESYSAEALESLLLELIVDDVLEPDVIDDVIPLPPAPPQPPRKVAKAELNKLKHHPDPRVVAAVAAARDVQPTRRAVTVKPVRKDA